ncbi:leucine-rich repeat protein [Butyricimonas synergistica]|uniref:leucine-rich repeat protein n=1 Tax=Butyricimonas synergistica TaxID=544644 RepID=UPI00036AEA30|nr:leucine-rich repeat protein [Butyricimonas synergistica]
MGKFCFYIICCVILGTACSKETKPTVLPPTLILHEATGITRNTAHLSGEIMLNGDGTVRDCYFVYGVSPEEVARVAATRTEIGAEVVLENLKAGTEYCYYLEVSNGGSTVCSEVSYFRTYPNTAPVLKEIALINKGPTTATVVCTLVENGGEALTFLGFKYRGADATEELFMLAEPGEQGVFRGRLTDLNLATSYVVRAYAANSVGEIYTDEVVFTTDDAIYISEPGTLSEVIGEGLKYQLSQISVSGKLNGSDFRLLRDMLGQGVEGENTPGMLSELYLTDARIVEGGMSYSSSRYTANDTLSYGMFMNCRNLREIALPNTIKVVEKDVFKGCTGLTVLTIPDNVQRFAASEGCTSLQEFRVSVMNPYFEAENGILYDKGRETLLLYPEGKVQSVLEIPAGVKKIADQALQNLPADTLYMAHSVTNLGLQVFRGAKLKKAVLSDGLATVSGATFQNCVELRSVTLGRGTMYISDYCFDGCALEELTVLADIPPTCASKAFGNADFFETCVLYVPSGSKNSYRYAEPWKKFKRIVEIVP